MSTDRRDRLILDLRGRGWTLRRIAQHPQVRMTHQGVAKALERLDRVRRAQDEPLSVLQLWRWARAGRDPEAVRFWGEYRELRDDMVAETALKVVGRPVEELAVPERQALQARCGSRAIREIERRILAA